MKTDDIVRELLSFFYSELEEIILVSLAAGVPFSQLRIKGPELVVEGYSAFIRGGLYYD